MSKKPFRWTKRARSIRTLLQHGYSRDNLADMLKSAIMKTDWRDSEKAMITSREIELLDEVVSRTDIVRAGRKANVDR